MSAGYKRLGAPPRPRRPAFSTDMKDALQRHLAVVCGALGCVAIEARAMWEEGDSTIIGEAEAAACESDARRLRRIPRKKEPT